MWMDNLAWCRQRRDALRKAVINDTKPGRGIDGARLDALAIFERRVVELTKTRRGAA